MKQEEQLQEIIDLIDEQVEKAFPPQKVGELMFYYYDTVGLRKESIDKAVENVILNYRKALIKKAISKSNASSPTAEATSSNLVQ